MEGIDRTERLLALILLQQMKGAPQREKILQLSVAGLTNVEIADVLQTTPAVVSQSLYEARRGRGQLRPSARTNKSHRS
jgi:DNA-directed RNA polymerase specialized sigma24 family protein